MRPFKGTISLDEARAIIDARDRADRRASSACRSSAPADACSPRRSPRAPTCRPSRARRWTATPSARRTRPAPAARHRARCAASRRCSRDRCRCRPSVPGQCIEIATGAPMPAGADAVVIVEETDSDERQRPRLRAGDRRAEHRPAGRRHPEGPDGPAAGHAAQREPRRGVRRARAHRRGGVRQTARGDPLDRQRDRRAGPAARAGPDLRHQPLHARRRSSPRTAAWPIPYRIAADTIEDLSRSVDECLEQDVLVFSGGSSVGERDLILDVVTAKGEMLFHGIAVKPGKPTAFGRIDGKLVFGMPGYPVVLPVERLHPAGARAAADRPASRSDRPLAHASARLARRVGARPASVLYGAHRERRRRARVQGVGRHHEHVAGRRLHRDPRRGRSGRMRTNWSR